MFILIIQFIVIFFTFFSLKKPKNVIFILVLICFFSYGNSDFVAYNTEWILFLFFPLIFKTLQNKPIKYSTILLESILIFSITLIKFQYIPLAFVLFLFQITRLFYLSHYTKVITSYLFCVFIFCSFFSKSNLILFYNNYFENNFNYTKSFSTITFFDSILLFFDSFFSIFNPIMILGFLIFIIFLLHKNEFSLLKIFYFFRKYFNYLSLILVLSISIILPRTNFAHYFIILIYPITFVTVNLLYKFKKYIELYVVLIFVIFIYNIYHQRIILKKSWGYTNIIPKKVLSKSYGNSIKLNFHDSIFVSDLDKYLVEYSNKNNKKKTIFIHGWFESLLLYYRYNELYSPVFKLANSIFLTSNNKLISKNYNTSIMDDFKNKGFPNLIVLKSEHFFTENTFLQFTLKEKYIQDYSDINFKVFILKNN